MKLSLVVMLGVLGVTSQSYAFNGISDCKNIGSNLIICSPKGHATLTGNQYVDRNQSNVHQYVIKIGQGYFVGTITCEAGFLSDYGYDIYCNPKTLESESSILESTPQ